jgi:hypothetical protein
MEETGGRYINPYTDYGLKYTILSVKEVEKL